MHRILFEHLGRELHEPHVHLTVLRGANRTTLHDHDFHEVFLVVEGTGIHHWNGNPFPLKKGDIAAIRPRDRHRFETLAGGHLGFINLALSTPWVEAYRALTGTKAAPALARRTLPAYRLKELRGTLEANVSPYDPLQIFSTWRLFQRLLVQGREISEAPCPTWLQDWRSDLTSHPELLAEPISFWQARAGRSAEHLARSCRKFFHATPSQLLAATRIALVKQRLLGTNEKVISVAMDAGFGNMAHFHKLFAQSTGQTPSQWRKLENRVVP